MIQYLYLGRVAYDEGLRLQAELVELRRQGRIGNVLLLLEHPPVLTLGRNARRSNVLASDELLARRGITLHEIDRGGDVTYHGPGQLVGYPIFDLRSLQNPNGGRLGPVDFVRLMEEALIRLCGTFGVRAGRISGLTGVWCGLGSSTEDGVCVWAGEEQPSGAEARFDFAATCGTTEVVPCYKAKPVLSFSAAGKALTYPPGAIARAGGTSGPERKIGAIGIHVSRSITSHGFAFNVTTDLGDFALINPCGIVGRPVTSLELEVSTPEQLPTLEAVANQAARQFGLVFEEQILAVESLEALRAQAAAAAAPSEFPAQDTPLQIPSEVERLRGAVDRPVRA